MAAGGRMEYHRETGVIVNDERTFLHDLASPLATLLLITETAVEDGRSAKPGIQNPGAIHEQTYQLLERLKEMLADRRKILIERSEKA